MKYEVDNLFPYLIVKFIVWTFFVIPIDLFNYYLFIHINHIFYRKIV